MTGDTLAILHVALNPVTGPWSVMRTLARAQRDSGLYVAVGLGVMTYPSWPDSYRRQLKSFEDDAYESSTPALPGTLSFLLQLLDRSTLAGWVKDIATRSGAKIVVVHFHNAWLSGVFLPCSVTGVKVVPVATFHGVAGARDLSRQPVRRWLHRMIAERLVRFDARLTTVDNQNLTATEKLFHLLPEDFVQVPNGLYAKSIPARKDDRLLRLAHVGTLNSDKGWRIVVDVVIQMVSEGLGVELWLAGEGPDQAEVARLANEYPECIRYLGQVDDPIDQVFSHVDLLVLMTANDGLPMVIIEALSCGIPVISTPVGGIPQAIADQESGFLIERGTSELRSVLNSLVNQPDRLASLRAGARANFQRQFEMGHVLRAYDAVYRDDRLRVTVAQKGARERYVAARVLQSSGQLHQLLTDWYPPDNKFYKLISRALGNLGARLGNADDYSLQTARVVAFATASLLDHLSVRLLMRRQDFYTIQRWLGQRFARRVAARLGSETIIFIYAYAARQALQKARDLGIRTILDQIDPGPFEFRLVQAEEEKWPDYVKSPTSFPEAYYDDLQREWSLADLIVVNSEWSREALVQEGVPDEKVVTLPLAVQLPPVSRKHSAPARKLQVLFLGQVNLRKGIPYLIEAARELLDRNVEFQLVGPLGINPKVIEQLPVNMFWKGVIPKSETAAIYADADVFVLPTVSDGFALTQLEAMSYGIPVIATKRCGQVVQEGVTGYLIEACSTRALVTAIERFIDDPLLHESMYDACRARAAEFSFEHYAVNLEEILQRAQAMPRRDL